MTFAPQISPRFPAGISRWRSALCGARVAFPGERALAAAILCAPSALSGEGRLPSTSTSGTSHGRSAGIQVSDRNQAASPYPLAFALSEPRDRPARIDLERLRLA